MSNPLVSVIVPSYNHAKYIGTTLRSIFSQTFRDFEVIVVDDCSTDESLGVVNSYQDGRLKVVSLKENVGGSATLNVGIRAARGEFIAICNSDDAWVPSKLARQLEILCKFDHVAAVFSDVQWIDQDGGDVVNNPYEQTFSEPNRQRPHWLRRLIEQGNCLCHPSVLIRAKVYEEVGLYNEWLRQLPDLDMWLRLITNHDIYVSPEKLVKFRWHGGNTSTPNVATMRRSSNEHALVIRQFFRNTPHSLLRQTFGFFDIGSEEQGWSEADKAHYLLTASGPNGPWLRQVGGETVMNLLADYPESRDMLEQVIPPSMMWTALAKGTGFDSYEDSVPPSVALERNERSTALSVPMSRVGAIIHETKTVDLQRIIVRRMLGKMGFVR